MSRIPPDEYIKLDNTTVVTKTLLDVHHTPEEIGRLKQWMRNQTCAVMQDGKAGIFSWDYERWLRYGMPTIDDGPEWD